MRFNSPDSLSPFGDGGLNGYAYCVGDPVNRSDPTGHFSVFRILIRVSVPVSVGAFVGSFLVEDKTARLVLSGLSIAAAGTALGGAGLLKYRQLRPPRLQRSNVASQQGEIALGDVSPGRRRADPPPPYPGSHRLPQPASSRPSDSEQIDAPPPSYEEAVGSIDRLRSPQNLEPQLSLPPHQPRRRTLSSRSLSPSSSDISQEAWHVRRLT